MITGELKSQVDKIWTAFWTGGISNPLTVIEQFTFLLFIRRLDEKQQLEEKKANITGTPMTNPVFNDEQQELRWSAFKNKDPETMFELFTRPQTGGLSVFDHMKEIGATGGVFGQYMKGATFMIPTPRLLDMVVQMIGKIKMDDRDTKGDLYEYLLSKIATAGTNGQFRTPRHIIKLMTEMMQPTLEDTICDPSVGTAGFLVAAKEYIDKHYSVTELDKYKNHINKHMFNGTEFDASAKHDGGKPATFPVGGVIAGWTEALQMMKVGSKWELVIPPELAYGDRGAGSVIKPGSTLIFEIELLGIVE